jgi:endonuclease-3
MNDLEPDFDIASARALAAQVLDRLDAFFGIPDWRDPLPALDELVCTILSQNTNDRNRDVAFQALRKRFPHWEEVRDAQPEQVIEAIRPAGLANQKGPRIQSVLQCITQETGGLDLSFLTQLPADQVRAWLVRFNGVGPKTAAIVMQFSLGIPAFPVDTHVHRVTGRIGLRPEALNAEQSHSYLEGIIPPERYGSGHLNLIRLGREICQARKPNCPVCPLNPICLTGKSQSQNPPPAAGQPG